MFIFAPFPSKIWSNNFKTLDNAYGWGYTVCYEELHMSGWDWKNTVFSVIIEWPQTIPLFYKKYYIKILYQDIFISIYITIVIRNGRVVWKYGQHCWYFRLNLKYLGWPYRGYIKTARNCGFCEELLSENDFEAVLAIFCCYEHGAHASETVQKIVIDQKEYRNGSLCYNLLTIQNIPINK